MILKSKKLKNENYKILKTELQEIKIDSKMLFSNYIHSNVKKNFQNIECRHLNMDHII